MYIVQISSSMKSERFFIQPNYQATFIVLNSLINLHERTFDFGVIYVNASLNEPGFMFTGLIFLLSPVYFLLNEILILYRTYIAQSSKCMVINKSRINSQQEDKNITK